MRGRSFPPKMPSSPPPPQNIGAKCNIVRTSSRLKNKIKYQCKISQNWDLVKLSSYMLSIGSHYNSGRRMSGGYPYINVSPYRIIHPARPGKVGHTTTRVYVPYYFRTVPGSFTSHKNQIGESALRRDLPLFFSSLSEKTRKSNGLQMLLQGQEFLFSCLNTLSVVPPGALPNELIRR